MHVSVTTQKFSYHQNATKVLLLFEASILWHAQVFAEVFVPRTFQTSMNCIISNFFLDKCTAFASRRDLNWVVCFPRVRKSSTN